MSAPGKQTAGGAGPASDLMHHRGFRVLIGTLLVYIVLVATHRGEFWPFSIYPMFSQAGRPWARSLVRKVDADAATVAWEATSLDDLAGTAFPLAEQGIDAIDLANFVRKTPQWTDASADALHQMFYDQVDGQQLVLYRVNGHIQDGEIVLEAIPVAQIHETGAVLNPALLQEPRPDGLQTMH